MRVLAVIGVGLAIAVLVAASLAWRAARRSLPAYAGRRQVAGLAAPAVIRRDAHAVPHVFAGPGAGERADQAVFFGLGYAQAQDRLWQMDLLRRTAQGRLSERFGARTLGTDEYLRRLDLAGAARASLAAQTPEARAALAAYAAGVNARVSETGGGWRAAPELLLFGPAVEPWAPEDSLAILKLIALQLASHVDREVTRARASLALPSARVYDLLPDDPGAPRVDAPDYRALFPDLPPDPRQATVDTPPGLVDTPPASNAWAVAAARSRSGAPLLANDPHLDLTAPSIWYLARLALSSGDVIGATIPGIPAVLTGRTARTAWGVTAANVDDQDVVIERRDPADPSRVLTADGPVPLRRAETTIAVRGADPVTLTLEWSPSGPVIPGRYHDLAAVTPPGHVAVIARTLFDPEDTSYSAALEVMQAPDIDAILAAGERFVAPAVNLIVADRRRIALEVTGHIPLRHPDHPTRGRMPAPGRDRATRWLGVHPHGTNPREIAPASGFVANTNNRTVTRDFPGHVSFDWGDNQRIGRLRALLSAPGPFGPDDMIAQTLDTHSPGAARLVPLLLAHAGPAEGPAGAAQDLLAAWDFGMDAGRPEPALFLAWARALRDGLITGKVAHLAAALDPVNPVFLARVLEDADGASAWCAPDCATAVRMARDAALAQLLAGGERPGDLRWGDLHVATHDHPALGTVPLLRRLVNIRHPLSGGDDTLLRGLTRGGTDRPFDAVHAAGYRAVVDLGNADGASRFVLATGQSGHPLSRHYRDQNRLWRAGAFLPMRLDQITAAHGGTARLELRPAAPR